MLKGIDFAYGNGLTTAEIKAAGYSFVCRYLSTPGNTKNIDATELANYRAAGIPVVFVFETTGTDMTSMAAGSNDATSAQAQLAVLGAGDAPVFFAADEATEADMTGYMQGAMSTLGRGRTGIYGGYATIKAAFDGGLVAFGWQTSAWSAGQWDDRALLRQIGSNVKLGPATVDEDEAAYWATALPILGPSDDFGQWPRPVPAPAEPAPAPVPTPAPAPVPAPTITHITVTATYSDGSTKVLSH